MFPKLTEIVENNLTLHINEANVNLIKEIQTQLKKTNLYKGEIDGIAGKLTIEALANFKESIWLTYPELIGVSTAGSLLEVEEHKGSTESSQLEDISDTNEFTGSSMLLPTNTLVYANQRIISDISLTWGEMTKNCKRIPESKEIVNNIIEVTKLFGEIRDKWNDSIIVTSGYRPPAINKQVGGASRSQHILGKAIDCQPAKGNIYTFYEVVSGIMRSKGTGGLGRGMRLNFVHIDTRNTNLVVFNY